MKYYNFCHYGKNYFAINGATSYNYILFIVIFFQNPAL